MECMHTKFLLEASCTEPLRAPRQQRGGGHDNAPVTWDSNPHDLHPSIHLCYLLIHPFSERFLRQNSVLISYRSQHLGVATQVSCGFPQSSGKFRERTPNEATTASLPRPLQLIIHHLQSLNHIQAQCEYLTASLK
jgi:hypothetical protein